MEKRLNNPFSFYLATSIIILYVWRLVPFGDFFNIFIAISILIGLFRNKFTSFLFSKKLSTVFYFIISGIIISIFANSVKLGSFSDLFSQNQNYTALKYKSILEGLGLFIVLILNINSKNELSKFIKFFTFSGVILIIFWLLGISSGLIQLFGFETYLESSEFISSNYSYSRYAFETLDENTFGSICCVLFTFCLHFFFNSNNKFIYSILILILVYSILLTVSRTVTIRFIIQLLVYLYFSSILFSKHSLKFIIILSPLIIYLIFNNPFGDITFRFTEFYLNINEWYSSGILQSRDSFQYRIIRSLLGVPETFFGWFFGSGGVQTARFYNSSDHIEYTNWLWQYGLVTFIPLLSFIILLVSKARKNIKILVVAGPEKSINSCAISIIIGMLISMFGNPQFHYLWITLSLVSLIVYFHSFVKLNNE